MRLLLDTHALLHAVGQYRRLSLTARDLMEDTANELLVSSASVFEIATKHRIGKLPITPEFLARLGMAIETLGATPLPVNHQHALVAGQLAGAHRDPFDRLLAAQALVESLPLVTNDPAFRLFDVECIW